MRRSMLLPTLLGALAMLGVPAGAAQASELPEFGQCVKVAKGSGEFKDKNCLESVGKGGNFAWTPLVGPIRYNDEDRGATFRYFVSFPPFRVVVVVTCKKSESLTEYVNPKDVRTLITYVECSTRIEGIVYECSTPGLSSGTVRTSELAGSLGYIDEASKEVGIDFASVGDEPLTTIECHGLVTKIRGAVIAKVTGNVNKMSAKNDQTYEEREDAQVPDAFEGGPPQSPFAESQFGEQSGEGFATIAAVEKESGEEKIEIKA
jgi:hypothetical protein